MRFYTDSEVDLLIEELTEIALEAIEQAASEAARAAILSMLDREVIVLREAERWRQEAYLNLQAFAEARRSGRKNTVLGCLIGVISGFAFGIAASLLINR